MRAALAETGISRGLIQQRFQRVELRPAGRGEDTLRGRFTKPLYALVGIAALVLLLATANISNLLLARGFTRRREFAIRLATGAGRMRLARQLVTETLLLFACGAIPGVAVVRLGTGFIEGMFAEGRRSITITADLNWRVLGFAVAVTLSAGLLSALFPAWRVFRSELEQVIREGQTRSSESRAASLLRQFMVASQVAVSLVLLVGAIAFTGTLAKLRDLDPGFHNDRVLTMSVELPEGYVEAGRAAALWRGVADAVHAIPEVKSASLATFTPLSQGTAGDRWRFPGTSPRAARTAMSISITFRRDTSRLSESRCSMGGFSPFGTRKVRRELRWSTRRLRANSSPGATRSARFWHSTTSSAGLWEWCGTRNTIACVSHPSPSLFCRCASRCTPTGESPCPVASMAPGAEAALLQPIRRKLAEVEPGLMISEVISIRREMDATLLTERLLSGLATVFGALAMTLASIGLYGMLSYRIGQQRQSIGIRMALVRRPRLSWGACCRRADW